MQKLNVIDNRLAVSKEVSRKRILEMDKSLSAIVSSNSPELSEADGLIEDLHVLAEGILQMNRRKNWFWEPMVGLIPGLVDKHGDSLIREMSSGASIPVLSGIKRVMTKKTFATALDNAETHPLGDRDIPTMASNLMAGVDQWFEQVDNLDEFNFEALQDAFNDRTVLRDMRLVSNFVTTTAKSGFPKNSEFGSMITGIVSDSLNHG